MSKTHLLLLCLFVFLSPSTSKVIEITNENLNLVYEGNWFIEIYAPWCGFCKKFEPVYETVATSLAQRANVSRIDGAQHQELALQFLISGFPTIFYVQDSSVWLYDGPRTAEALTSFALDDSQRGSPLPWYLNPLGIPAHVLGKMGRLTIVAKEQFEAIVTSTGFHPAIVFGAAVGVGAAIFLLLIFSAEFLFSSLFGWFSPPQVSRKSSAPKKRTKHD